MCAKILPQIEIKQSKIYLCSYEELNQENEKKSPQLN